MVPVGVLWLCPEALFRPADKTEVVSAIVIICASWLFYGAVAKTLTSVPLGLMAQDDPHGAMGMFFILSLISVLIILGLMTVFWLRVLRGELGLKGGGLFGVSTVFLASIIVLALIVFWSLPEAFTDVG